MRARLLGVAILLVLVCPLGSPALAGSAAAGLAHVRETPHYHIETDIGEEFAEVVARHMEEIHKEYAQRFRDYGEPKVRYNVLVFRREADYRRHVPRKVHGSTGVFNSRDRLLAAHADGRTAEEVLRTLYHEGFHQFMYLAVSPDCPVWLNEGLAEYFAEATWDGERFQLGEVPTPRLRTVQKALRTGHHIRFRKLFSMDTDAWLQNVRTDNRRADLTYAECWSIVHFLAHGDGGRYAAMLDELIRCLSQGDSQETALQKALGPNLRLEAFERAWAQHVLSMSPSPKSVCRDRMETLMHLARIFNSDVRRLTGVEELRHQVMHNSRLRWELTRSDGRRLSSDQPATVAQQFVCPLDRDPDTPSFVVVTDPATSLPVLVCDHHPGVIIKAYYKREPTGKVTVEVEEEVRQLANPELKKAIAARLAQFR